MSQMRLEYCVYCLLVEVGLTIRAFTDAHAFVLERSSFHSMQREVEAGAIAWDIELVSL